MREKLLSPEWVTDKFIIIMLAVFPLFTGLHGYSDVTFSKFMFFVCVTGAWILLTASGAAVTGERPRAAAGGYAVIALALIACLSALLSPYGTDTVIGAGRYDGLLSLLLYCVIFLGVSAYGKPRPIYYYALAFSITVCCIISVLQLLGRNPLGLFPAGWNYFDHGIKYSAEFLGCIGNVDVFSTLLCLAVPLFFGAFINGRGRESGWLLFPAVFGLFIAIESEVSSARLGLAVGFAVSFFVLLDRKHLKKLLLCAAIAAVTAVLALNVSFTAGGVHFGSEASPSPDESSSDDTGMVYEVGQMLRGHFEDSYGSGRIGIWRQLLGVYPQSPIIGGGPGTVSDRVEINYSRYVEETGQTLKTRVDNAHNEYLGYLMDEGALGLVSYLTLVIMTFIRFLRRRHTPGAASACGLAAYWVQSFFGLGLCLVLPAVWVVWGLFWCRDGDYDEKQPLRGAHLRAS